MPARYVVAHDAVVNDATWYAATAHDDAAWHATATNDDVARYAVVADDDAAGYAATYDDVATWNGYATTSRLRHG